MAAGTHSVNETDGRRYIVLGCNSNQKVQAFGTFKNENAAQRWARQMERKAPGLTWLPLPICHRSDGELQTAFIAEEVHT